MKSLVNCVNLKLTQRRVILNYLKIKCRVTNKRFLLLLKVKLLMRVYVTFILLIL